MSDEFAHEPRSLISPASKAVALTPNNDADLANIPRAIYVGGAGNLTVTMLGQSGTTLFTAVPAGTILPIQIKRLHATGTTAAAIVAVW